MLNDHRRYQTVINDAFRTLVAGVSIFDFTLQRLESKPTPLTATDLTVNPILRMRQIQRVRLMKT
ncbi:MAG: hypothetical protein ACREBD_23915, partial [Blastocatellia bacterium]